MLLLKWFIVDPVLLWGLYLFFILLCSIFMCFLILHSSRRGVCVCVCVCVLGVCVCLCVCVGGGLVALLWLYFYCLVAIGNLYLFLAMPWIGLLYVIMVFPGHTQLLLPVSDSMLC